MLIEKFKSFYSWTVCIEAQPETSIISGQLHTLNQISRAIVPYFFIIWIARNKPSVSLFLIYRRHRIFFIVISSLIQKIFGICGYMTRTYSKHLVDFQLLQIFWLNNNLIANNFNLR